MGGLLALIIRGVSVLRSAGNMSVYKAAKYVDVWLALILMALGQK